MAINGITVTPMTFTNVDVGSKLSGNATFFDSYTLSSTSYVYNQAGEQAADSGLIPVSGAEDRTIGYNIVSPTGVVTVTIYGRIGSLPEAQIYSFTKNATSSGFIEIAEAVESMRIGIKISAGSATVSIQGRFKGMQFI